MPIKNNQGSDNIPLLRFPEFQGDWEKKKLGEVAEKINSGKTPLGGESVYTESGILFIRSQNVTDDKLSFENSTYISEEINSTMKNSVVKANDILLNITGASLGRSCVVPNNFTIGNVNQHVCIIRLNKENNPRFVQPILSSTKGQNIFVSLQTGSGREGLNFESIKGIEISFPTLPEQTKIASFLTAVDEKIQALKKKHSLLEQYKKGVMQKLFSQETEERGSRTPLKNNKKGEQLRFKDENGNDFPEWEDRKLSDILIEVVEKTESSNQYKILSSTAKGLFYQDEYFTRDIASKDNSGYKILRKGQLVFSPQNLWLGNINVNTEFEVGIVSPSYKVFSFNVQLTNADFCQYFLLTPKMLFEYEQSSVQGASVVRRNLDMDRFLNIAISIPSLKEQKAISNLISSISYKLKTLEKQVRMTEDWKKGLLQKMFC